MHCRGCQYPVDEVHEVAVPVGIHGDRQVAQPELLRPRGTNEVEILGGMPLNILEFEVLETREGDQESNKVGESIEKGAMQREVSDGVKER